MVRDVRVFVLPGDVRGERKPCEAIFASILRAWLGGVTTEKCSFFGLT